MANTTDKSILTAAGKALLAQLNAEEKPLIIDKMIFANVPNRPEYPQPDDVVPTDHIVHQEQVEQRGRLSADSVIYSTTLTSGVGPFEFNWTGAYCSEYGVLVTIDHHALTPKTADQPGVAGNTLVRSVVLEYKDIAEITNITVDASSWQYNATPRMKKMDDDVAQAIIDQNGKDWFIEDGFLVTPQASAFNIKAGAGYVSGNRVTLEFDRNVQVPNKPSFIYIDAHREGTPTGEQVTLFDFVITAEEKDDYTDANEVKHFVCKIAQVLGDDYTIDCRNTERFSEFVESGLNDAFLNILPTSFNKTISTDDKLTVASFNMRTKVSTNSLYWKSDKWLDDQVYLQQSILLPKAQIIGAQEVITTNEIDSSAYEVGVLDVSFFGEADSGNNISLGWDAGIYYGNLGLTKFEVIEKSNHVFNSLPTSQDKEFRAYTKMILNTHFGNVAFYNTHLSFVEARANEMVDELIEELKIQSIEKVIVTGDFNLSDEQFRQKFKNIGFGAANNGKYLTSPSRNGAIDEIFFKGFSLVDSYMIDVPNSVSDHALMVAKFK